MTRKHQTEATPGTTSVNGHGDLPAGPQEPAWTTTTTVIAVVVFTFFAGLFSGQELLHRPQVVLPPPSVAAPSSPSDASSSSMSDTAPASDTSTGSTASGTSADRPDHNDAIFKQAIATETDASRLLQMGEVLGNENRPDLAILAYQKAIRLGATSAATYRQLGVMQLALGKLDEAATALRSSIRIDSSDPVTHYALGFDEEMRHNLPVAKKELWTALGLHPQPDLKTRIETELKKLP